MKRAVALLAAMFLAAACSSPSLPPPLSEGVPPSGAAASTSPAASAGGSGVASLAPSVPPGFTAGQAELLASLRDDAQVGCAPRTENLPPKATDGIECTIGSDLVERVGVYRFASTQDALAAYIARMASYGVALRTGDCLAGKAGDVAWVPGDGPVEGGDQPWREGCFIDENGKANIRLTCGLDLMSEQGVGRYIGILGASTKIRPLLDWADAYPQGVDQPVPGPPGICVNATLPGPD